MERLEFAEGSQRQEVEPGPLTLGLRLFITERQDRPCKSCVRTSGSLKYEALGTAGEKGDRVTCICPPPVQDLWSFSHSSPHVIFHGAPFPRASWARSTWEQKPGTVVGIWGVNHVMEDQSLLLSLSNTFLKQRRCSALLSELNFLSPSKVRSNPISSSSSAAGQAHGTFIYKLCTESPTLAS